MFWLVSANGKKYNHEASFQKNGFIDWRETVNYNIGDIVFIYCTAPVMKVMYKCRVEKNKMQLSECIGDYEFWIDKTEYGKAKSYARLKLVKQVNNDLLHSSKLKEHGLVREPQKPIRVSDELYEYINQYFTDTYSEIYFGESSEVSEYSEGYCIKTYINKYERNQTAREKCIEYHGYNCMICGLNFEKKYGVYGKQFIHVHHLKPLHLFKKEYKINYKKDLIPVCPNCHAMIHRISNDRELTVDEIKSFLNFL